MLRPVDKLADTVTGHFTHEGAKDLAVAKDKPTQLSNGTPTREVEIHGILNRLMVEFLRASLSSTVTCGSCCR